MNKWLLLLTAGSVALANSAIASEPIGGTWEYENERVSLAVTLRPDGECFIGATLKRDEGSPILLIPCVYSFVGDAVTIEPKHRAKSETPVVLRLTYNTVADTFVVEEEPNLPLKRRKQWSE